MQTKYNKVSGIIDSVQIRALDIGSRKYKVVDQLQANIQLTKMEFILMKVREPEFEPDGKIHYGKKGTHIVPYR